MTELITRTAGRIVLLDAEQSVLLVHERYDDGTDNWLTPGGGVEPGESPVQAARRELYEETGLDIALPADAEPWRIDRTRWSYDGQTYDQTNHYFIADLDEVAPAVRPINLTPLELATLDDVRWWRADELTGLARQAGRLWPIGLDDLLAGEIAVRRGAVPVRRHSARVALLDGSGCVLLLEHRLDASRGGTVWATPGGAVEERESPAAAARRELAEECGIRVDLPGDAVPVQTDRRIILFEGVAYDQFSSLFVAQVAERPAVDPARRTAHEEELVLGHRWFSVGDLAALTATRYEPANLIAVIEEAHR